MNNIKLPKNNQFDGHITEESLPTIEIKLKTRWKLKIELDANQSSIFFDALTMIVDSLASFSLIELLDMTLGLAISCTKSTGRQIAICFSRCC